MYHNKLFRQYKVFVILIKFLSKYFAVKIIFVTIGLTRNKHDFLFKYLYLKEATGKKNFRKKLLKLVFEKKHSYT